MRVMFKGEFGNEVIFTKKTVAFSELEKEVRLEIQTTDGIYYIKIPAEKVEDTKYELLIKGYLDAREFEIEFLEY